MTSRGHGSLPRSAVPFISALRMMSALLALGALAGCGAALLEPKGPIGVANRTLMLDSLAIMLAIVVPTIIGTLAIAWWYRASNARATYLPRWEFSGKIELVVWAIPTLTILLLGGVTWIGAHRLDPAVPIDSKAEPLEIQVVALDWKWLFVYPKAGVASVNELVVPAGVPLHFSITSASVLNTFFVPQLGSMIYAMNGMSTELHLQADVPGRYAGLSGHFSGDGFSDMHFVVRAVPADAYAGWLESTRGSNGSRLDAAAYASLAKQGSPVAPMTFASVEPGLFDQVVAQSLPPGPGPDTERRGSAEAPAPTSTSRPPVQPTESSPAAKPSTAASATSSKP
ncbi:MAG: ubiquinol oxidase subunit II [Pseudomonadota bacterium]|nr:ubiquinol oxidase subunit II [Pseudomonadota bacterium]